MTAAQKRAISRWLHLFAGSALATYVYSPWSAIPAFQYAVKWVLIPAAILTGLWMWKGHLLRSMRKRSARTQA
jgi:hypothetical protein